MGSANKKVAAVLGALCLAALAGLLLLCVPARDLREPPAYKYGIVLDAGSSHTALFVYKWPADKENDTGIVSQHGMCDVEGGGISSYAENPPEAGASLRTCLDEALAAIPRERHAATPLYLGATAGMRLLNVTDPYISDRILEAVSSTLKQYPFDFRGARILSGEDEGVFGWVTANYLLENFIKYGWLGQWVRPKKHTLGAMDLGGASTQITFETPEEIESHPANAVTLWLYGQTYKVYTHSFLCYGRDQILKRLLSRLLRLSSFTLKLDNPCWPKGYSRNFTMKSVYDSPCTAGDKPLNYFPSALVTMRGTGNTGKCQELVASLFNFQNCPYSQCSFDKIFQPNITGNFIAFSAFFYTVDFVQLVTQRRVATSRDLAEATVEMCNATWSELYEKAPRLEKFLADYCPMANFVYLILTQGYKFNETTFPDIAFQKKAGETSIGWALGYMLNLTNMIPAEETGFWKGTEYGPWVGLVLLLVGIILVSLATAFCLLRSSKGRGTM